jgi:hypothetical protein
MLTASRLSDRTGAVGSKGSLDLTGDVGYAKQL